MKFALLAILSALFVSCASKAPLAPVPQPPPKAVQVAPAASKLREDIASIDRTAVVINQNAGEAATAADRANAEAARLRAKGGATAEELEQIYQLTQVLVSRNSTLLSQSAALSTALVAARATAASLEKLAADKDTEAAQLRDQLATVSAAAEGYREAAGKAIGRAEDAEIKAARAEGEMETANLIRNVALFVAGALLFAWGIRKFVLKR